MTRLWSWCSVSRIGQTKGACIVVCNILHNYVAYCFIQYNRLQYNIVLLFKSILGLLPPFLCSNQQEPVGVYALNSQDLYILSIPLVWTEFGKQVFGAYMRHPAIGTFLQNDLKMQTLVTVSMNIFRSLLSELLN